MPRFLLSLKPDFSIIISTSTFDMIYYSNKKTGGTTGCYITKQRCSIEKRCSKKRKDYGRTNEKTTPVTPFKSLYSPLKQSFPSRVKRVHK
jgi:hypothetical protein